MPHRTDSDSESPIGTAHMAEDGTIVLDLRAGGAEEHGVARFTYAPNDPQYREIVDHLGGIEANESKLVPPWPDAEATPRQLDTADNDAIRRDADTDD